MNIFEKIRLKTSIEARFLLEQKWGLKKPSDPYSIPKYLLRKYLPKKPVIIDCGAHVGADSVELAKLFPAASIHSFEPLPEIFKHLKRNTRKFQNIHCYQMALSNHSGFANMYVSSGISDASSSLLTPTGHRKDHPGVHFENNIQVPTITLDEWADKNNISQVDFLWFDMQGLEYRVLNASSEVLPKVKAIHSEVSMREAYAGSLLYPDFRAWLEGLGFTVVSEAIPEGVDMGNALFVKQP